MWKWYDSEIVSIREQSKTTRLFKLKVHGDEPINFKAGQFVTMDLPISEKRRNTRTCAYKYDIFIVYRLPQSKSAVGSFESNGRTNGRFLKKKNRAAC